MNGWMEETEERKGMALATGMMMKDEHQADPGWLTDE